MKDSMKKQRGLSLVTIFFLIGVFLFILYIGLKISPIYADNWTIRAALKGVAEDTSMVQVNRAEIYDRLQRRLTVNNVTAIKRDDITVTREGNTFVIRLNYVDERQVIGNLHAAAYFDHQVELDAR